VRRTAGAPGAPEGRIGRGEAGQARPPDIYRSALALVAWWVWFVFAVATLIDIAVQGRDRLSLEIAAILVLVTGIVYVAALRPRVIAAADGIVVRNPLRDHRVPWLAVTNVDLRDTLRVHCAWHEALTKGPGVANKGQGPPGTSRPESVQRTRVIQAWAIQSPRRAAVRTGLRPSFGGDYLARRSVGGGAIAAESPGAVHRKETERIARALAERARRERADAVAIRAPEWPARPVSAWHWPSVLAVVVPALLVVAAILA